LELTSKVEALLIGQFRVFFNDRGERLERVACEAEPIFVDYLHRLPAASARLLCRHDQSPYCYAASIFPSQQLFECLQPLDCFHDIFVRIACLFSGHFPNMIESAIELFCACRNYSRIRDDPCSYLSSKTTH
jgi:hypothetical protein